MSNDAIEIRIAVMAIRRVGSPSRRRSSLAAATWRTLLGLSPERKFNSVLSGCFRMNCVQPSFGSMGWSEPCLAQNNQKEAAV